MNEPQNLLPFTWNDWGEIDPLLDESLPREYRVLLTELDRYIASLHTRGEWWKVARLNFSLHGGTFPKDKPHWKDIIEANVKKWNEERIKAWKPILSDTEIQLLFAYTTHLYYRRLNALLWQWKWASLKIITLLSQAVDKLLRVEPIQFRWDTRLFDPLMKEYGLEDYFETEKQIEDDLINEFKWQVLTILAFFSTSSIPTEPYWSQQSKYRIEIHDADAGDITPFALFPNFWDEVRIHWVLQKKTLQESLMNSGFTIEIEDLKEEVAWIEQEDKTMKKQRIIRFRTRQIHNK
jgi:hypothetical protein